MLQWLATTLIFVGLLMFTFTYRNDEPNDKSVKNTVFSIFKGMKSVWFTWDPAVFVIPAGLSFFFFILMFIGNISIFQDYLRAPPFSASQGNYQLSILTVLFPVQAPKITLLAKCAIFQIITL